MNFLGRLLVGNWDALMAHLDGAHRAVMRGLMLLFWAVIPGGVFLAWIASTGGIWGGIGRALIWALMMLVFVRTLAVTSRFSNLVRTAGAGLLVGIPAPGTGQAFSVETVKLYAKSCGLLLVWSEFYLLILLAFPFFVSSLPAALTISAAVMVLMVVTVYATTTGMIKEGPWHRPVIATVVAILLIGMYMGLPKPWLASVGIPVSATNPAANAAAYKLAKQAAEKDDDQQVICIEGLKEDGLTYEAILAKCPSKLKKAQKPIVGDSANAAIRSAIEKSNALLMAKRTACVSAVTSRLSELHPALTAKDQAEVSACNEAFKPEPLSAELAQLTQKEVFTGSPKVTWFDAKSWQAWFETNVPYGVEIWNFIIVWHVYLIVGLFILSALGLYKKKSSAVTTTTTTASASVVNVWKYDSLLTYAGAFVAIATLLYVGSKYGGG